MNNRKLIFLALAVGVAGMASFITKLTFFSDSGPVVVDYWAFAAGIFLVLDGLWGMARSREDQYYIHFLRLLRISVGICIFTIHFLQYVRDGKLGVQ